MDKKKALLVVIIAAILAFGVAVIFKQDKKIELPQNQQEQESVLNKEEQETTEMIEETKESENFEEKNLPAKQAPIKPEVKSTKVTTEFPVNKPVISPVYLSTLTLLLFDEYVILPLALLG